jgi:hypothetical protein
MPGIPEAPLKPAANAANAALNQLDVHSFLYAATYVAGYQEEGGSSERPLLPPQLAPPLTTTLQVIANVPYVSDQQHHVALSRIWIH